MAIIYTYPTATPSGVDNIIGTQVDPITEENKTVQFNLGEVNSLATQNYLKTNGFSRSTKHLLEDIENTAER